VHAGAAKVVHTYLKIDRREQILLAEAPALLLAAAVALGPGAVVEVLVSDLKRTYGFMAFVSTGWPLVENV
jgi:hypothetical protein